MKFTPTKPPREFGVGTDGTIKLKDCAHIALEPDEQVTFVTGSGAEHDVVRKSWGYYALPSLNGRLKRFNLRPLLILSKDGKYFLLLVERGREGELEEYMSSAGLTLVRWLDEEKSLAGLRPSAEQGPRVCLCGAGSWAPVFSYEAPPDGETRFKFNSGGAYRRQVLRCQACGHFISVHGMGIPELYAGEYVDSTYADGGIERSFKRIIGLDPSKSDNAGRVRRIVEFAASRPRPSGKAPSILDVGSGLCVFLHRMKAEGWRCTALDPDQRAAEHARQVVGVDAVRADFMSEQAVAPIKEKGPFDAVAFNKVLEHVPDPAAMLARAAQFLAAGGFIYVELPDGEAAAEAGPGREEFFIEHHHVFSAASFSILAARAGFSLLTLERLREPSGKYTLRGFLTK